MTSHWAEWALNYWDGATASVSQGRTADWAEARTNRRRLPKPPVTKPGSTGELKEALG